MFTLSVEVRLAKSLGSDHSIAVQMMCDDPFSDSISVFQGRTFIPRQLRMEPVTSTCPS